MDRFRPIQIVKNQFLIRKEQLKNSNDVLTNERLKFIEGMLNNERCFFEINRSVAIEILCFLGFDDDYSFELYDKLTDYEEFKGNFSFIEDENNSSKII